MIQIQPSQATADPTGSNALVAAVQWIEAVLLGSVATAIAVIAISVIGMMMLSGRINLRRGATVIVGCFVLFGAATIARGLRDAAGAVVADPSVATYAPPVVAATAPVYPTWPAPPTGAPGAAADPYAGAAIRR